MDDSRRRRRVLGWGGAALAGFYGLGAAVMVPWVQDDLTDRVEAAAASAGFDGVTASFSGQDGTLHCAEPIEDPTALLDLAADKWGVRVAELGDDCRARVAPPTVPTTAAPTTAAPSTAAPTTAAPTTAAPTTAAPTTVAAESATGLDASAVLVAGLAGITLTGTVESDAQRTQLVTAATEAFGAENVTDELEVAAPGAATADAQVDGLAQLIGVMDQNLVEGTAIAAGGALALTGVYVSEAAQAEVTAVAEAAGVAASELELSPRAEATADQAAELEAALNAAVGASPIPFESGSALLTPAADTILDQVAGLAREFAGVNIAVNGHTDSDGSDAANLTLSQNRADTVRQALIERGVPAEQLVAQGFGETDPVAQNDTPANKALNRRVVFSVATQ